MNFKQIAKRLASKPLTKEELKLIGLANVFLMDYEADGGVIPDEFNNMASAENPEQARKIIKWCQERSPGSFWD